MKLWILRLRLDHRESWINPWGIVKGFVVRATNEAQAREIAEMQAGDESYPQKAWLRPEITSCEELLADGDSEIILRDFVEE